MASDAGSSSKVKVTSFRSSSSLIFCVALPPCRKDTVTGRSRIYTPFSWTTSKLTSNLLPLRFRPGFSTCRLGSPLRAIHWVKNQPRFWLLSFSKTARMSSQESGPDCCCSLSFATAREKASSLIMVLRRWNTSAALALNWASEGSLPPANALSGVSLPACTNAP